MYPRVGHSYLLFFFGNSSADIFKKYIKRYPYLIYNIYKQQVGIFVRCLVVHLFRWVSKSLGYFVIISSPFYEFYCYFWNRYNQHGPYSPFIIFEVYTSRSYTHMCRFFIASTYKYNIVSVSHSIDVRYINFFLLL